MVVCVEGAVHLSLGIVQQSLRRSVRMSTWDLLRVVYVVFNSFLGVATSWGVPDGPGSMVERAKVSWIAPGG